MTMSQEEINKLLRTLGSIDARMEMIESRMLEDRRLSENHRSGLLITITAMSQSTMTLTSKVETLNSEVQEMKPLIDDWRTARDQAMGAAKVAAFFKAVAASAAAGVVALVTWIAVHINQVHK